MKNLISFSLIITCVSLAFAGNPERQGQAGVAQLTINGFGKSSGLGWSAGAGITGVEATYMNVAGMDRGKSRTELVFCRTLWLQGSGIGINTFGFTQQLGEDGDKGTIGLSVMQFGIKPISITTEQNPDGGIGTYRVNMTNIGLGYSKSFSRSISAGIMFRAVSEGIPDAKEQGISLDCGVQYATTMKPVSGGLKKDDLKFGISIKNIGPDLRYTGDGLSYKATINDGTFAKTMQIKPDVIKLPSLLNIAASYDIRMDKDKDAYNNKLTVAGAFTNYAFSGNQTTVSLQYCYKDFFSLRGGYVYQAENTDKKNPTSAFTGPFGGISFEWASKSKNVIALDYSYRATNPFSGCHSFGIRIGLGDTN